MNVQPWQYDKEDGIYTNIKRDTRSVSFQATEPATVSHINTAMEPDSGGEHKTSDVKSM